MTINDLKPLDLEPVHDTASAHEAIKQAIITTNVATQDLYKHMTLLGTAMHDNRTAGELMDICCYDMPPLLRHTGHLRNDTRALLEHYRQMTDIYARLQSLGVPFVCGKAFADAKRKHAKGRTQADKTYRAVLKQSEEIFTYWMPYLVEAGRRHIEEMEEMLRVADANGYADLLPREPRKDPFEGVEYNSDEFKRIIQEAYADWKDDMELVNKLVHFQNKEVIEYPERKNNMAAYYHNFAVRAQYALDYVDWFLYSRKMMLSVSFFGKEDAHRNILKAIGPVIEMIEEVRDLFFEAQEMETEAFLNDPQNAKLEEKIVKECIDLHFGVSDLKWDIRRILPEVPDVKVSPLLLEPLFAHKREGYIPLMDACADCFRQLQDFLSHALEQHPDLTQLDTLPEEDREHAPKYAELLQKQLAMELKLIENNKIILSFHPHFYFLEAETYEDPHQPDFTERPKRRK